MATTTAVTLDEVVAAEAEALAALPAELAPMRLEYQLLSEKADEIEARRKDIREAFGQALELAKLNGFVVDGKVRIRRSVFDTARVNSKALRAELPNVWARFVTIGTQTRVTVD